MNELPVPICRDCQHYHAHISSPVPMCERGARISIVTGLREVVHPITCAEARQYGRECGPEGRMFKRGAKSVHTDCTSEKP